jgi:hypothetical protein
LPEWRQNLIQEISAVASKQDAPTFDFHCWIALQLDDYEIDMD